MPVYLSSPYSHRDPAVREERYQATLRAVAALMAAGHHVFSPIVYGHPLVRHDPSLPSDFEGWRWLDEAVLSICDALWVLTLDGWQDSVGTLHEVALARRLGLPVRSVDPEDYAVREFDHAVQELAP